MPRPMDPREDCQSFGSDGVVSSMDTDIVESVTGIEHGGSRQMNTHRTGQTVVHRGHLCLVAPVSPEIRLSRREVRAMSRVAVLLRRRAARLPEDSLLRAELMEAAEYYATGADQASTGHSRQAARRDWTG